MRWLMKKLKGCSPIATAAAATSPADADEGAVAAAPMTSSVVNAIHCNSTTQSCIVTAAVPTACGDEPERTWLLLVPGTANGFRLLR